MAPPTDADIAKSAEDVVRRRLEDGDLDLPALPTVAVRCLALLGEPEFSLAEIARLIVGDPAVAARILRLANRASKPTQAPAQSAPEAVMRVGAGELRTFLIEATARPIFESHDPRLASLGRALWAHSVGVALLARAVARRIGSPDPEAAYLGGLLHDIGKPIVAAMLLDAERRLVGARTGTWLVPRTWLELIARSHRRIALALAVRWPLPELVRQSLHDLDRYDAADPRRHGNIIRFANVLAKQAGVYAGDAQADEVSALVVSGCHLLSLPEKEARALTADLRDDVDRRVA